MSSSMGGDIQHQLDNDKSPSHQRMVSTGSIGEETRSGEQVDQSKRKSILKVPVECYSRVVGYLRPVQGWNVGKKQEWLDRVVYSLGKEEDTCKSSIGK